MARDPENKQEKLPYPKSVFFIVCNEFCERFSYYGMKAVLALYLTNVLRYSEDTSTVVYHAFGMLCYFTPIFGALIADTYWGKFKTILYLSILYAFGNIMLSASSIPGGLPREAFSLIGLLVIAIGTGGIKPCVSAFGGDQFVLPKQGRQLEQFFSIFYFSINAGSLLSTILTPMLREVECFDEKACFPLAFGVPAILMIVAVVLFVCGKPMYKMKEPEGNIIVDVSKCVGRAVKNMYNSSDPKKEHWLDYARDKYDEKLISDIKTLMRILVLYLPLPMFWALMDQQGSRWTFQARRMNGDFFGYTIKPDQMQVANPLLVLALVPVFDKLIYPVFAKCNLLTSLQRITVGGILAGVSFIVSGVVELYLEPTYAVIPQVGHSDLNFINGLPCSLHLKLSLEGQNPFTEYDITGHDSLILRSISAGKYSVHANIQDIDRCQGIDTQTTEWSNTIETKSMESHAVLVTVADKKLQLVRMPTPNKLEKTANGDPQLKIIFDLQKPIPAEGEIYLKSETKRFSFPINGSQMVPGLMGLGETSTQHVDPGRYTVYLPVIRSNGSVEEGTDGSGHVDISVGGCYLLLAQRSLNGSEFDYINSTTLTPPNSVHMLWLLPQYFFVTVGEVMFSVTGLQFSFTQAPASMKSVIQAVWLLTVAFGNIIVILVAEAKAFDRQSMEFFLFAVLMFLDMVVFMVLAYRYKYVEHVDEDQKAKEASTVASTSNGKANQAYESDTGF